jgi:hypothetical protein
VVAIRIHGDYGNFVDDYAFLDDGSTSTMMDQTIADRLQMRGEPENLHFQWSKGITRTEETQRCDVTISGSDHKTRFTLKGVFCVSNLDLAPVSQDGAELAKRYEHLRGIPLPSFANVRPGVLIGLKHASLLGGNRVFEGHANEPLASRSKLGWIVYGPQVALTNFVRSSASRANSNGDDTGQRAGREDGCNRTVGNMAVLEFGESSASYMTSSTGGRMSHSQRTVETH